MNPEVSRRMPLDSAGVAFVLVGLVLGWALIASTQVLYLAQGRVATLLSWLPVGYAFAAGMVAAVNPCGILLLPSLAAYALAREAPGTPGRRAARALAFGGLGTLGFVLLFGAAGLAIGAGGYVLARAFPYGGLLIGVALVLLGTWLALSGREFGLPVASRVWERTRPGNDLLSFFGFGVAYGICSLACTLPVFLAVVGSAVASGSWLAAAGRFLGYAVGMGTVLTAVLVGVAFFEAAVHRWVRAVVPYVHRLAAAFLIGAGIFMVGYWWRAF
ncbi:MAG: cytochrome c biogenesis protein CcdA [Armatimonadota bacterium]|nr:cytochrome c biogenesis protein CcdA [Armatimonadota bacterium]MDR7444333.1 cytochrome c biogenesis protein CcdA [Armatimonadota bacterium]MDR7569676.1 cytochrome c biogenesis protein CcdA [Armatimonadota bacterium]MDR7614820.1 cytochrome c biogenesis protein CcdA [Armatimonadota bacterium]